MLPPRLDAAGVKLAPSGTVGASRPISPAPAAIPVSDARQAAFQRSLSGMVGQTMKGEVLSKYDDGSYLVRVAGNSARMMLPGGAQVGAEVPLTLIATTPRPTFQVGMGAQGTQTAQLYTEAGLPPGDTPDAPGAQPRLPSQDTTGLPGRNTGLPGQAGQAAGQGAPTASGQPGAAAGQAGTAGQPGSAALPGAAGGVPGQAGAPGTAAGSGAADADGSAGNAAGGANSAKTSTAGAAGTANAANAANTASAAAAQAHAGLSAQAGNVSAQANLRTAAQAAAAAAGTTAGAEAVTTAGQPGAAGNAGAQGATSAAGQARPQSLAAALLGRAPLTPADQLPGLGRDTPTAALSQAARTIASALAGAYSAPGVPATINGKTPLVSAGVPDADQLAHSLKNALGESGLFYESHVAEWAEGKRPLQELMREPQNQRAQAQQGGAQTSETLARAALASPDLSAAQMINQQLHAHEQQRVQWNGQAWPGQPMQWEVQRDQREGSQHGQEDGAEPEQVWRSGVRFRLPLLGKIAATVTLVGEQVHIQVQTGDGDSADTLRAWSSQLQLALEAAGSPLASLTISQDGAAGAASDLAVPSVAAMLGGGDAE
ncbi:flagellar hook-length control protein FliK [Pseudoduganella sp. LjRoot289]|uniref:flagellar hook-length control protein FliK n=1 Tax=Pseudoduganella sp. LjRoot289 TaxID=3342314 RepID=UPI003ECF76BA